MNFSRVIAVCAVAVSAGTIAKADEPKLPPEVTPELRAACESDVRRIGCMGPSPTYDKVKSCVISRYTQLGQKCKVQLAVAGYSGPTNAPKATKAPAAAKGWFLEAFAK